MGPNQGQGVPAMQGSEGLAWDLFPYNVSLQLGHSFSGPIPRLDRWGLESLQAVVSGVVTDVHNVIVPTSTVLASTASTELNGTGVYPALPGDNGAVNRTQVTLSDASLQDLTSQVAKTKGNLKFTCPKNAKGVECNVFFFYLIHSDCRAQASPLDLSGPQSVPQSYIQNGSWAVDHFSALEAKTTTDFWEQHVLTNGTMELLMAVGNYAWEDSIEIYTNVYWTKNLPAAFVAAHGYSLTKWLPILFHQNRLGFGGEPPVWWITDANDFGNDHIADYRQTVWLLSAVHNTQLTGI